ncbi:MAG TPA: hypothetical protein VFX96_19905 [Pyrinomonadaceae bacterium]|nr:hypothetical protein [Pyrinomonadaceae bacterium]
MDTQLLRKRFALVGARVKVSRLDSGRARAGIDIRRDEEGEFFDIRLGLEERVEYEVIDAQPRLRHLLLMARGGDFKEKFLCGHDERHWFVSAIPYAHVSSVTEAMWALQPFEVRQRVRRRVKRVKMRLRRRNKAFVRQGEWFFVPAEAGETTRPTLLLRNVPLRRDDQSKPHVCEEMCIATESARACDEYPNGVSEADYQLLLRVNPLARKWDWKPLKRRQLTYVRGRVSHPDHKTITLHGWHRALLNTEHAAPEPALERVVFYD